MRRSVKDTTQRRNKKADDSKEFYENARETSRKCRAKLTLEKKILIGMQKKGKIQN